MRPWLILAMAFGCNGRDEPVDSDTDTDLPISLQIGRAHV